MKTNWIQGILNKIVEFKTLADGVYVDNVNGVAGTDWPIGTPGMPVDNLTDAITIATARKLSKFYLIQPNLDQYLLPDTLAYAYEFIGWGQLGVGGINLNNKDSNSSLYRNTYIHGIASGSLEAVDCEIEVTYLRGLLRNCLLHGTNRIYTYVWGQDIKCCRIGGSGPYLNNTDGADADLYAVTGPLEIINSSGGMINIHGQALDLVIANSCVAGTIDIWGDAKITDNSGVGCTVNDYTNKPRTEAAVNINAIAGSETNFLNLATAGYHYTIDDLVLKCVDPGAATVTVRLYKLVNGGSVLIHSFTIVTGAVALERGVTSGFGNYLGLDDMFTRTQLAGDNIKITVRSSANTYAVTGSYAYRTS